MPEKKYGHLPLFQSQRPTQQTQGELFSAVQDRLMALNKILGNKDNLAKVDEGEVLDLLDGINSGVLDLVIDSKNSSQSSLSNSGKDTENISDLDYIKNYFFGYKTTQEESFVYFWNLKMNDILGITLKYNTFYQLCKASGYQFNERSIHAPVNFKKWLLWLFGDEYESLIIDTVLDEDYVRNYFFTYAGDKKESFLHFWNFSVSDLRNITLKGKKILNIAMVAGYPNKRGNIASVIEFREFLLWLFGDEYKKIVEESESDTANKIKDFFFSFKGDKKSSFYYFYELQQKDIQQISFEGMSLYELCKATGYPDLHKRIYLPNRFKNWMLWLFGDEFIVEAEKKYEMTIADIEEYFFHHKGMNKEDSFKHFLNLRTWELHDINIKGNKLYKICAATGYTFPRQVSVSVGKFQTWLRWFFWERTDSKITASYPVPENNLNPEIKLFFSNFEGRNIKDSFLYLYGLDEESFSKIQYNGFSLRKAVSMSGYPEIPFRYTSSEFKKWLMWLFSPESEDFLVEIEEENDAQNLLKVQQFFFSYEGRDKLQSFKYLIGLNGEQLKKFRFEGKSLLHAVKISSYPERFFLAPKAFKEWLIWLFGEEFSEVETEGNPLTLKNIQNYFFNYNGKNKNESYDILMNLTAFDIESIILNGFKIQTIVSYSGYPLDWSRTPSNFKKWIDWLFFESEGTINETGPLAAQINFLFSYKGSKEESFLHLWNLKQKEIMNIEIVGYTIYKFARILACPEVTSNPHTPLNFRKLLIFIFGEEFLSLIPDSKREKEGLTRKKIEDYFFNFEGKNKTDSFWHFYNLKRDDIVKLKVAGYGYTAIASVSGYGVNSKYINSEGYFRDWLVFLFGDEYKKIVEDKKFDDKEKENHEKILLETRVKEFFFSYYGESKKDAFFALWNLSKKDLFALEFEGKHVLSLVTATGYNSTGISFTLPSNFRNFLVWLFGEEYHAMIMNEENEIKNEVVNGLLYIKPTKEESFSYLSNLKQLELKDLIINGRHIIEMARISGFPGNFRNLYSPAYFREWIVWFFNKYSSETNNTPTTFSNSFETQVKNYFFTMRGTKEDSFWYLYNLNNNQIVSLEFEGLKIEEILRRLNYSNPSHIRVSGNFRKWLIEFFNIDFEKFQRDMLEKGRNDLKDSSFNALLGYIDGDKDKSFEYFLNLSSEEISALRIDGKKIIEIANLLNYDLCSPRVVYFKKNFIPFIFWVFSQKDENLGRSTTTKILCNFEGKSKRDSYSHLSSLSKEEFENLSFFGVSLISFIKISGFDLDGKPYVSHKAYKRWLNYIFNESVSELSIDEKIKEYFCSYNNLNKSGAFRYLYSLGYYDLIKIKYDNLSINEIINASGFRNGYKYKKSEITKEVFSQWLIFIFGDTFIEDEFGGLNPGFVIVRDLVFQYKGNKDESFMYFLLANTVNLRKDFKLNGLGLKNIVNFSGYNNEFEPNKENILSWVIYLYGEDYIKEKFDGIHPGKKLVQDKYFGYSENKEESFMQLYCAFEDERRKALHIIEGTPYSTAIISGFPYDYPAVKLLTQVCFREFLTWIFWGDVDSSVIPDNLKQRIIQREKEIEKETYVKHGVSLKDNYYGEEQEKTSKFVHRYLGKNVSMYGENAGREAIKQFFMNKYGVNAFLEVYFTTKDERRFVLDVEKLGFLPTIRLSGFEYDCRVQNLINRKHFRECIVWIFFGGYENIPLEIRKIVDKKEDEEKRIRLENNLEARRLSKDSRNEGDGVKDINIKNIPTNIDRGVSSVVDDALGQILEIMGRKKEVLIPTSSSGGSKYSKLDLYLGFKLPDLSLVDVKPTLSSQDYVKWMKELYTGFPDLVEKRISFQSFFTMLHEGGKFYSSGITRTEIMFILTQNGVYKSVDEELEEKISVENERIDRHEITEFIFSMHEGKPIEIIKFLYELPEDKIDEIKIKGNSIKFLMKNTQFQTEYSNIEDYKKFICWLFFLDYPLNIN